MSIRHEHPYQERCSERKYDCANHVNRVVPSHINSGKRDRQKGEGNQENSYSAVQMKDSDSHCKINQRRMTGKTVRCSTTPKQIGEQTLELLRERRSRPRDPRPRQPCRKHREDTSADRPHQVITAHLGLVILFPPEEVERDRVNKGAYQGIPDEVIRNRNTEVVVGPKLKEIPQQLVIPGEKPRRGVDGKEQEQHPYDC